jgi:mRNA-degrading endonuclease toxin of MazEF toxin-antitoxin module
MARSGFGPARQVRWISVDRLGDRLGVVHYVIMLDIDEALRLHLGT